MSSSGPKLEGGSWGVGASEFIEAGTGNIKLAKLISTLLGAVWLTAAAGWIIITQAIVTVHLRVIGAVATLFTRVIRAFGQGGAETLRESWQAAFLSATQMSKLFAPLLLTVEIVVVSALLLWARRRWT